MVQLKDIVDGFGVGTAVAYPPSIDFSAKIVEVREKGKTYLRAKRGGLGGRKDVHRSKGFKDTVVFHGSAPSEGLEADAEADNRQGRAGGRLPEHRLDSGKGSQRAGRGHAGGAHPRLRLAFGRGDWVDAWQFRLHPDLRQSRLPVEARHASLALRC